MKYLNPFFQMNFNVCISFLKDLAQGSAYALKR